MKKIPTLFVREYPPSNRAWLTDAVTPGCEWVLAGEGAATAKYDGTAVLFDGTSWWTRREVKAGKTPPANWMEVDADPVTGKRMGWEPIAQSAFHKVFATVAELPTEPGTYELIGPKINGNPHGLPAHQLYRHGSDRLNCHPSLLTFDGLCALLSPYLQKGYPGWIEGYVWHHPDGRMAKLKARDFR